MVPTLACIFLFGGYGAMRARKAGGKTPDILQYAASFGFLGMIVGVLLAIVLTRLI